MAEWYESDPIVEEPVESDTSWFENDELVSQDPAMSTPTAEELQAFSEPVVTPEKKPVLAGADQKIQEIEEFAQSQDNPEVMNKVNELKLKRNPDSIQKTGDFETDLRAEITRQYDQQYEGEDELNQLYEETVGARQAEAAKYKKDYAFYASGPNAKNAKLSENFEPTTDMYDDVSDPDALYEYLVKQKQGTTITGRPTYNNRVIPEPTDYTTQRSARSSIENPLAAVNPQVRPASDLVGDTIRESGKDTLVKVAALVDEASNAIGYKTNLTKLAEESIADPAKANKVSHQVAKNVIRTGTSLLAGAKSGAKVADLVKSGRPVDKWILSTATAFSVDALTANVDNPNMLVGDDADLPIIPGSKINEGDRDSLKVLKKTGDYALDNAIVGGAAAGAFEAGAKITGYGKNLVSSFIAPWFKGDLTIAKEEAQKFMAAGGIDTPEKLKKVVDDLRTKGEVELTFADGTIAPITLKRSSMSAVEEGAKETSDDVLANAAMETEKSAHKQNMLGPSFDALKQQPIRTLSKVQKEAVDARGGVDAIEQTKNLLADNAIKKIDKSQNLVTTAKSQADDFVKSRQSEAAQQLQKKTSDAQLQVGVAEDIVSGSKKEQEEATAGLMELFQRDKPFATAIDELSRQSGIDVGNKFRMKASDDILPDLVEGVRRVKQKKNDLYTAIPDDADIDEQSFLEALDGALKANALPADAQRMLTKELGDDPDNIEMLSFGKIYKMLPKINKAIIDVSSSPAADRDTKLQALEALRDNINKTQMQHLIDTGEGEVVDAARNAVDYYKNIYIKFARDKRTPIGSLFDEYDNAFDDHLAKGPRDQESGKLTRIDDLGDNYLVKDKAQEVAETGLSKKTGSSQQVADFVKNEDTGIDRGKFLGPYKGKVLDALHKVLEEHGGDFSQIKPYMVNKALEDEGVSLTKHFPEDTQKINDFIEEFKTKKGAVTQAEETVKKSEEALATTQKVTDKFVEKAQKEHDQILDDSKKVAKDAVKKAEKKASSKESEVWKSALGKFIEKSPDGSGKAVPVGNGYVAFRKMLNSDGNANKIKYVADQVRKSGDKNAQKGLEAAMHEHLKDMISDSNVFKVKGSQVEKLLSDSKDLKNYGKIIFGNSTDPEEAAKGLQTFDSYIKLVDFVNTEQLKSVSATGTFMDNKDNTIPEAKKAANYLIGVIWGRFNSTSLRLSGTAGRFIETTDPVTKRKNIISALHEHPDYLADILELVKEGTKAPASSELKRALILTGILTAKQQAQKDEKKMPEGVK